ncbi:phosphoribosylamine--glycine ligase [Bacteroidota bacterium]
MNVLIIGSGGREHALSYKIAQSGILKKLFIAPGNPGTTKFGENININTGDFESIRRFCIQNSIDLVVIGPEKPLVDGLGNFLREKNINVFGPNKDAAIIEGQKSYAKALLKKYNIPTADYKTFKSSDSNKCFKYLENIHYPTVIKASGLAAGKGVIICENYIEAKRAVDDIFIKKVFGSSGNEIIIEEFLNGQEASIFAITDGYNYLILPSSQDHKRVFNDDKGKNTGGMGAYAPAPIVNEYLLEIIENKIVKRTLNALREEGRMYIGCLYVGLMIKNDSVKVVEYNCRFGDPEAQVVLPILEGDFLELLYSASIGKLKSGSITYTNKCAICVITASEGYPEHYKKGFEIKGINDNNEDLLVFHSGTKLENGKLYTNGGRVLGITAINREGNLNNCKKEVYGKVSEIYFKGIHYRTDISDKALR